MTISSEDEPTGTERRAPRKAVAMRAQCRTATGRSGEVVITDLTSDGCRIFTKAVHLKEGLQVRIRPENFESLAGIVRWVAQGHAGIEFERPLYGPTAEHLQRVFANS